MSCCSKLNSNNKINRTQQSKSYSDLVTINAQTTEKKCKRNSVFFVLCSHENSTKFRHEISSKRWRIFVESNEISLSSWRNFASTEAKFRFLKIRTRETSPGRKFALAKFPQSEISLAMETGRNDWIVVFAVHVHVIA